MTKSNSTTTTTGKDHAEPLLSLIARARQAVHDMNAAMRQERELDTTGMPVLVARQLQQNSARAWTTAAVKAAKLLPDILDYLEDRLPEGPKLTPLELETARNWLKFAGGMQEFADVTGVTEPTMRRRIASVYRKVGADSKYDLERIMKLLDLL